MHEQLNSMLSKILHAISFSTKLRVFNQLIDKNMIQFEFFNINFQIIKELVEYLNKQKLTKSAIYSLLQIYFKIQS